MFLKVYDFPSIIISHILHHLLLHLVHTHTHTPRCVVFSPNVEEMSILLGFLGCLLLLMIFVVSSIFLILSLFLSCFRFFNSSGLFFLQVTT